MATTVGVYTRVAGVWQRCNDGTPVGFSGPQTRVSGAWQNMITVETKQSSVWSICWVNIDGEIDVPDRYASDFDEIGPPWIASVTYNFNSDGTSWRIYDCGRDYEIRFVENTGFNPWTSHPTLSTWLNLTDPATNHSFNLTIGFQGSKTAKMDVCVREKVSAPAGGNDCGEQTAFVEAGQL